jgi:hypothetical protein
MRETPVDVIGPLELELGERVRPWLDQAVVPIDAAAIARAAAAGRRPTRATTRRPGVPGRVLGGASLVAVALTALFLAVLRSPSLLPIGAVATPSVSPEASLPSQPVEFWGYLRSDGCAGASPVAGSDGVITTRGDTCRVTALQMTDPRLEGAVRLAVDRDAQPDGHVLLREAYRIENEGGSWQQGQDRALERPDGTVSTRTIVFVGEGGYAGWAAVTQATTAGPTVILHGFLVDRALPPSDGTGDPTPSGHPSARPDTGSGG